ncbi:MAG TPA: ABC transporter permease [Kineosporiaceae bacterium]|jgi:ribose transport system permease protein|nr:ABC transporter permease [Kineosporiaceae bacterium]
MQQHQRDGGSADAAVLGGSAPRPAPWRLSFSSGSNAVQRILAFGALIALVVFFSLASDEFFQVSSLSGILVATAVNGLLALGVTLVITTGGIDLSVGTVMTLSAVMTGKALTDWHLPLVVGLLVAVATGALCGLGNGLAIARLGLPPFIATLGMLYVARGAALVISQVKPIYFSDSPGFYDIANGNLLPGVPNGVLVFGAGAVVAAVVLGKTVLGRYVVAIGSNEEATRLSGVATARWKILTYVVSGAFAGVAGIVLASRVNSAQPSLGMGYELDAIAAAVIGGTSLSGGEGTVLGTVIGAFFISTLAWGLRIMSVSQEWQILITGLVLIVAVFFDVVRRSRQST